MKGIIKIMNFKIKTHIISASPYFVSLSTSGSLGIIGNENLMIFTPMTPE